MDQVQDNENNVEISSKVEKINLNEVKEIKAEENFKLEIEKIKNDPLLKKDAYRYLKQHREEFKEIFGFDIKFDE